MAVFDDIKKDIIDAIKAGQDSGTKAYDTEAEVIRTDGSTAWVHIPGGVDETPVKMTIHCEPNDKVQVRVSGGSAWLAGNETAPPTDDTTALEARLRSVEAGLAAQKALANAEEALTKTAEQAYEMATAVIRINADIEDLQDQIDGNITTWYYNYAPTLSNEPASTWTTDAEKDNHLGDMFLDMDTGYSYRFVKEGSTYKWLQISDEGVSKALAAAAAAQDTADHKRRVFISTPTPPYDEGDLWCEGLSGEILTCVTAKTSTQVYAEADWEKMNKYTDDTAANEAKTAAQNAWNYADSAHEAAQTAWNHADEANNAATSAASAANAAGAAAASAQSSADSALASAGTANTAANSALTQLSVVEDVVDVLNWVSEHGTYAKTNDTSVVTGKYYFTKSGSTYSVVTNPTGNPKTKRYYELSGVDEAVSNYISSHLALTNEGLWVISDNSSYKILLASDGMKVYDSLGNLVSTFGESIVFSSSRPQTIGNSSSYVKFYKDAGVWKLAICAQEIKIGSSAVATETYADEKANEAQQAAEGTAAEDATNKANAAENNAKNDAAKKLAGFYATSATAAGTAAKAATITPAVTGWTLYKGATITVKFTTANTAASPTLNVNSTGAKPIKTYSGGNLSADEYKWAAGSTFSFTYNGTNWLMQDSTMAVRVTSAETSIEQNSEAIALRATKTEAQGYANTAERNAKTDTTEKLKSYSTTTEMNSAIETKANEITSSVSTTYATKTSVPTKTSQLTNDSDFATESYADGKASDAETAAKGYADTQIGTAKTEIKQTTDNISSRVTKTEAKISGHYATSSTAAGTAAKAATITPTTSNWELYTGASVTVKFTNANTNASPTLNVNSKGAKAIKSYTGANLSEAEYKWVAGATITFVYNGSNWLMQDGGTTARISSAETTIQQTANNVLIKATQNDTTAAQGGQHIIDSLINVAPEGIKISADKVNIEGAAIFSSGGRLSETSLDAAYDAKGSASAVQTNLDNIEIGGRNLLRNTKDFAESTYSSTCTFAKDSEGITVITFPAYTGSVGWKGVTLHPNIPYTLIRNKTVTLSFWYRSDSWTLASGGNNYPIPSFEILANATDNPSRTARLKYQTIYDSTVPAPTTEWQRFVRTYNITDSFFTAGSGTVTEDRYFTIQMFQHNLSHLQYKKIQLEIGNKVTDWTPAPEDVESIANGANAQEQLIYISKATGTTSVPANTTWVTNSTGNQNVWTTKRPEYNQSYPVLFVATQRQTVSQSNGTTCTCTTPMIDDTTTVIDGGNIITNTVTAEKIDVNDLFAQDITATGTITGAELKGAKGTFTRGFGVDILFDMTHGTIIDDKSEAADTWERKYIRMDRDSVVMGFATDDGEGGEMENDFFRSYRNPAHPATILTLASVYLQLYGMYIQMQGNISLTGSLDVTENAAILGHKMVYEAGDEISCEAAIFAGHLTTSKKAIEFFIPLPKPTVSGITATMAGNWGIRHADGGYILNGATLASIGTVTTVITELGVRVNIALTTAASFANNSIVDVAGWAGSKITFS